MMSGATPRHALPVGRVHRGAIAEVAEDEEQGTVVGGFTHSKTQLKHEHRGLLLVLSNLQSALGSGEPLPMPDDPTQAKEQTGILFARPEDLAMIRSAPAEDRQEAVQAFYRTRLLDFKLQLEHVEAKLQSGEFEDDDENTAAATMVLPDNVGVAAMRDDVDAVIEYLGPERTVAPARINAPWPEKFGRTLLHEASYAEHHDLLELLLQRGADPDAQSSSGMTALYQATYYKNLDLSARILLRWGARKDLSGEGNCSASVNAEMQSENFALSELLRTELGGRSVRIVGLKGRQDLNGCIGEAGCLHRGRYEVAVGRTGERVRVKPANLQQCVCSLQHGVKLRDRAALMAILRSDSLEYDIPHVGHLVELASADHGKPVCEQTLATVRLMAQPWSVRVRHLFPRLYRQRLVVVLLATRRVGLNFDAFTRIAAFCGRDWWEQGGTPTPLTEVAPLPSDVLSKLCCASCQERPMRARDLLCCPCGGVRYCSRSCQKRGWSKHKRVCTARKTKKKKKDCL